MINRYSIHLAMFNKTHSFKLIANSMLYLLITTVFFFVYLKAEKFF